MKKIIISAIIVAIIVLSSIKVFASENSYQLEDNSITSAQMVEKREKELNTLEDYKKAYEDDTYGTTAYFLNKVRVYSIPFCFLGIAISAIYQYVLGIRKMDVRDKGFGIMISIITIFVICQVLPLVFAIVVKGWRG